MKFRHIYVISIIILVVSLTPVNAYELYEKGFDSGPSFRSVVPLKKVTFVGFDEDGFLDDYSYLAAVPTCVFYSGGRLFSHPLLFYQDPYPLEEDRERSLNARQGLDYFMEDWLSYCGGRLDGMTLVNVPSGKVGQWPSRNITIIDGDDPFSVASKIALYDWSYSDTAVLAVIQEKYENPAIKTIGELRGTVKSSTIQKEQFKMQRPIIGLGATYETYSITDTKYKYILTKLSWKGKEDFDLQIYDPVLGMVKASATSFKSHYPYSELVGSYISNYGDWEISVSAIQKKSSSDEKGEMESMNFYTIPEPTGLSALFNRNTVDIQIVLLPGVDLPINTSIPYGCRNVKLTLKPSDPNVDLGFTVLDPIGTEIASSFSLGETAEKVLGLQKTSEEKNSEVTIDLERLGETRPGENYTVCVFSIGDLDHDVDFTIEYSWSQNFTKDKGDQIESACNGAVLASTLNAPLLYTEANSLSADTKDVLYKLGVKNIYVVDIGGYLSEEVEKELKEIADIKQKFTTSLSVYNGIREKTGENDVIFTTIEPYDYWYVANDREGYGREPAGQWDGAYHFAQASYLAAHHGSPVIIVDNHPILSQATTWPTDYWLVDAKTRVEPPVGPMVLTAKRAYEFLEENGFGKIETGGPAKQQQEIIITVAGQFDIGVPWDRCFTGAGLNGRFWGHPVDSAYLICRNIFYPALVFVNPAMKGVTLWQGSESKTQLIGGRLRKPFGSTLVITKPTREEKFKYPVLESFVTYGFRYNEEKWKHFNCMYARADDVIPWVTPSLDPIDDGAAHGKTGAYYPDMSESEVIPFYCSKAGYSNVFSTNFDYITENLNRGVLMWFSQIHGHHPNGGNLELWSPESPYVYEPNPWRTYEPVPFKLGHFDEFIRWLGYYMYLSAKESYNKDIKALEILGKIPTRPIEIFPEYGSTENPDVAFINYQLTGLAKITRPIFMMQIFDIWGPWPFMIYRDRLLHPIKTLRKGLPLINWAGASKIKGNWIMSGDGKVCISPPSGGRLVGKKYTGPDFDDALKNMHSVGINSISCFPAFTYLHLTWIRHGAVYIIMDPWSTTDWAGIWNQMIPKRLAMGDTVGQAYERSLRAVGPEYSCGQSWWDLWENIVYTGDPNLRVFVPNTEYTDYQNGREANYWEQKDTVPLTYKAALNIDGHTPFGATSYPHVITPPLFSSQQILFILLALLVILLAILFLMRGEKNISK